MNNLKNEFISEERRVYKIRIGHLIASSLSGFIAGAVVASLVWLSVLTLFEIL